MAIIVYYACKNSLSFLYIINIGKEAYGRLEKDQVERKRLNSLMPRRRETIREKTKNDGDRGFKKIILIALKHETEELSRVVEKIGQ